MGHYRKKPVVIEAVRWRGYFNNLGITEEAPDQPVEITSDNMHGIEWKPFPTWLPPVSAVFEELPPEQIPSVPVGNIYRQGDCLWIGTLEGSMRADPGDWIIKGVKGEIYPCKPGIFAATYDVADPQ
jgi:hypothetical protein